MNKDYLELFVSESMEHLDNLNNALLELENNTSSKEALNEIFRSMHTLKGMANSMGFEKIGKLTHEVEDVLDDIRKGKAEVRPDIVDILFKSFDLLEELIEKATKGDGADLDISQVLDDLAKYRAEESRAQTEEVKKLREYKVSVLLNESCQLKSARVFLVFKNLTKIGEITGSNPSLEQLEDEDFEYQFEVFLATHEDKEEIADSIASLPEVVGVDVSLLKEELKKKEVRFKGTSLQSVRVNIERLDSMLNLIGELIINKARLDEIAKAHDADLNEALGHNERLMNELQYEIMQIRMVPVEQIFSRFQRVVRDLAREQGKEIDFVIEGKEIELDRTVLDEIVEPMLHLIRNSVDHGIEKPSEREKMGKLRKGKLTIKASRERDHVVICVEDDGKGIDPEGVKDAAVKRGIFNENDASQLSDAEALEVIFKPGFSMAKEVTSVSGRGVGMDVVRSKIEPLGGSVAIESELGKGTKVVLELPLTLAIIQAMLVDINKEVYAIPMVNVNKIIDVVPKDIKSIRNQEVIKLYNEIIPLIRNLYNARMQEENEESLSVMIIERGTKKVGLVVDRVISQQEVVIKSLGTALGEVRGFSGATILGDGRVALILDTASIFEQR
ncbi:MAG: chemotaxis protein CheA [Candidatus Hydrothermarchaeales archaeon]